MNSNNPYKPGVYFSMTFIATYVLWFAGAAISFQNENNEWYMFLMLLGLIAPFVISLGMTWASGNAELKKDFLNRLINFKLIPIKMLPAALFIMPLSVLVATAISLLFGESVDQFQLAKEFSFTTGFVPVLSLLLLAATFEELGWRGYAFDSLHSRYNALYASILFGVLWSLWHLPLLFVKNSYQYEIAQQDIGYAINFFVSIIPMGVIISWICLKNNKSVLAAIGFHFVVNISQEALAMTQVTKCIQTGVLFVFAIIIIVLEKELFFSKKHIVQERCETEHFTASLKTA